jgi:hypothetical protein
MKIKIWMIVTAVCFITLFIRNEVYLATQERLLVLLQNNLTFKDAAMKRMSPPLTYPQSELLTEYYIKELEISQNMAYEVGRFEIHSRILLICLIIAFFVAFRLTIKLKD